MYEQHPRAVLWPPFVDPNAAEWGVYITSARESIRRIWQILNLLVRQKRQNSLLGRWQCPGAMCANWILEAVEQTDRTEACGSKQKAYGRSGDRMRNM
jgi:hypothetical protein